MIWRLILPQPAQTSPVALPEGGIAIQTEDLGCATAWRDAVANDCSARPCRTVFIGTTIAPSRERTRDLNRGH